MTSRMYLGVLEGHESGSVWNTLGAGYPQYGGTLPPVPRYPTCRLSFDLHWSDEAVIPVDLDVI